MEKIQKFGTFAGVFTPSLLTILGVIMYMRLGWVVGNAGLIGTIVIIIIAHIISVTTGLSISSVATDKKIGAGGVYYVLSRIWESLLVAPLALPYMWVLLFLLLCI